MDANANTTTKTTTATTSNLPAKHPFFKQGGGKGAFLSPTDQIQSPATKKIESKRKHLMTGIKPKNLGAKLFETANEAAE
ncbi:hypothetical protein HDU98_011288 [Podochytrium sp. JEL0797]|nr:hypothetical protein HDU98_011288 [Podochytrium sp. JEL0797]